MIEKHLNIEIKGMHGKPVLSDLFFSNSIAPHSILIFAHGFKGFKDWGPFNLVAEKFAEAGFVFVKFNFSHNGTTPENPEDFADVESFGKNNLMIELDDLQSVLDFITSIDTTSVFPILKKNLPICLMGHSRGGGIAILKGAADKRVKKIVTLASVNRFGNFFDKEKMEEWKQEGVILIENSRTRQQLPMYFQYYEALEMNKEKLDISKAILTLSKPLLIIHGADDETIPSSKAVEMHSWNPEASQLFLVNEGSHTFGGKHPWNSEHLPVSFSLVVEEIIRFLNSP